MQVCLEIEAMSYCVQIAKRVQFISSHRKRLGKSVYSTVFAEVHGFILFRNFLPSETQFAAPLAGAFS